MGDVGGRQDSLVPILYVVIRGYSFVLFICDEHIRIVQFKGPDNMIQRPIKVTHIV